jgi:hypothetical protein
MDPGVDKAVIPNNTRAETNSNGFNMVASAVADVLSRHLQPNQFHARIICHLDGIRLFVLKRKVQKERIGGFGPDFMRQKFHWH